MEILCVLPRFLDEMQFEEMTNGYTE